MSLVVATPGTSRRRRALLPRSRDEAHIALQQKATIVQVAAFERSWRAATWLTPIMTDKHEAGVAQLEQQAARLGLVLASDERLTTKMERVAHEVLGENLDAQLAESAKRFLVGYSPLLLVERRDRRTEAGTDGRVATLVAFLIGFNGAVHKFDRPKPVAFALAELAYVPDATFPSTEARWKLMVERWRKRRDVSSSADGATVADAVESFERYLKLDKLTPEKLRAAYERMLADMGATKLSPDEYERFVEEMRKKERK